MKKIASLGLFMFFLFGLVAVPAVSQTGDEVVEKMIEAMGGRKVLEEIKDMTISMSVEIILMELNATVTNYIKEPNLGRSDISVMGMVITQAFDGETAWRIDPQTGETEDVIGEAKEYIRRESLGYSVWLYPEKFGITFSYKGREKIEDKDYLVLEQTFEDGFTSTIYLDPETYLTFKVVSKALNNMMMKVDQEIFAAEYKKVQGLIFAHSVTLFQDGEKIMTSTVNEVKINTGLEDSLFKK